MNAEKKCRVCGDKALAFNFNALSCECCKIFFRRNAAIREKLNCRKDGACEIDFITRKCCAKCRLEKCFSIGMAIELRKKRNRFYKSKNSENEINLKQILLQDDQLYIKSNINVDYQKTKIPTKLEYEKNLISEIENSISIFEDEYKLPCIGEATNVQEAFNMPGLYARKIVKFCKNITAFKVLSGKDQFALLKPFYFEFIAIWLGFLYDPIKDGFPLLENESGHRVVFVNLGLCNQLNDKTIGQTMREFGIESKAKMENDLTIRNLIIAMLLFKPRDSVSAREFVRYQYHVYYNLLEKYFETKHSTNQKNLNQAKLKFTSLQHVLNSLDVVRDSTRRAIFELDLNKVAEIVYEVFGMENN